MYPRKSHLSLLLTLGLLTLGLSPALYAGPYEEGEHYEVLDRDGSDEPEVIEFFWYGCGTCNMLNPIIAEWSAQLPDEVDFQQVPAVTNPQWKTHGKAFYIAEALDVRDAMHDRVFDAIHSDGRQLQSLDEIRELFVEEGVSEEDFDQAAESFEVDSNIRRAENLAQRYRIRGTPTLIVNDRYRVGVERPGGLEEMLEVVDYLLER